MEDIFAVIKAEHKGIKCDVESGFKTDKGIVLIVTYTEGPNKGQMDSVPAKEVKYLESKRPSIF